MRCRTFSIETWVWLKLQDPAGYPCEYKYAKCVLKPVLHDKVYCRFNTPTRQYFVVYNKSIIVYVEQTSPLTSKQSNKSAK